LNLLFQNEIKFLGKIISADGIKINPENVVTVKTRKMFLLYHGWAVAETKVDWYWAHRQ
jgi:hypothetical protein